MLIQKGAGTLIAGDYVGRFSAGDLFLIGSNQPHVFRSDEVKTQSNYRVQSISLYFDEKYAGENFWLPMSYEPSGFDNEGRCWL